MQRVIATPNSSEGEKPTTHTEGTVGGGGGRKGLCDCFCAHMYERRVWQRRGWREGEAIVAWGKTNTHSFPSLTVWECVHV